MLNEFDQKTMWFDLAEVCYEELHRSRRRRILFDNKYSSNKNTLAVVSCYSHEM